MCVKNYIHYIIYKFLPPIGLNEVLFSCDEVKTYVPNWIGIS